MKLPLKTIISFLLLVIFINGCGGGGNSDKPPFTRKGTIEPETTIQAAFNNIKYPINVYLPPDHGSDPNARFPVLYLLDAETRFITTADLVDIKDKSVIVVGIGNAESVSPGIRGVDYRMPGAQDYYNFLTTQIIPFIDASYLTDTSERTLSGHSLGGLFTGLAILLEAPNNRYFSHYLSQDGSFWDQPNVTTNLELQLFSIDTSLPVQIIIASAEVQGNSLFARRFFDLLNARQYTNVDLTYLPYLTDHVGMFAPSMSDFIELIY